MSSHVELGPTDWSSLVSTDWREPETTAVPEASIEEPSAGAVVRTVLGLRPQELWTYEAVRAAPGASTATITDRLDRDRSNVNRSLMALCESGLVRRKRRLLEHGGYCYAYYAAPESVATQLLASALDRWAEAAHEAIVDREWDYSASEE